MAHSAEQIDVYVEIGKKRSFAGAIDWPGWCRSGREPDSALQALVDYGPRYAHIVRPAGIDFEPPAEVSALALVEQLAGDSSTDFGAPGASPAADARPVDEDQLRRLKTMLEACWQAFDAGVQQASGKTLRKGPRGGGRDLDKIVGHVLDADAAYLGRIGWKFKKDEAENPAQQLDRIRRSILEALAAAVHGQLPQRGPRGGALWTPRYFVRRVAWHMLDHLWEIQDRVE
jgi:hypothetical protein